MPEAPKRIGYAFTMNGHAVRHLEGPFPATFPEAEYVLAEDADRWKQQRGQLLEAAKAVMEGLGRPLPPNSVGEGNWLDTMPHLDEAAHDLNAVIDACEADE